MSPGGKGGFQWGEDETRHGTPYTKSACSGDFVDKVPELQGSSGQLHPHSQLSSHPANVHPGRYLEGEAEGSPTREALR